MWQPRNWHSRTRPIWRIGLIACLGCLRKVKNSVPVGLPFASALVLFLVASMLWRPLLIAVAAGGAILILQEIAGPTPLFWTVPWEALEFLLSQRVRVNHLWLHRTEELLRASGGRLSKIDGVATREGFFLVGTSFNETEVQWASQYAWRTKRRKSSAKTNASGCKMMPFLLALWLIAGGLTVLHLWRGINLANGLLLAALCGAAGQLLAKPVEKLSRPRAEEPSCSNNEAGPIRLEVESFAIPQFFWFKKGRVFQVRRMPLGGSNEG